MNKTFVIAEAGANHDGDIAQAIELIKVAVMSGADAVKFQTYSSNTLYSKNTPDFHNYKNIPELIRSLELPREWQPVLKAYCDDNAIEFMSTPFDERAVDELYELGVNRFKIAGFESTDPRLVKYIAKTGLPIIFSAGIGSTIESVRQTITWIKEENSNADVTILHCNNAYPTPLNEINLKTISLYNQEFPDCKIGLSDHTMSTVTPALAVAMGASVIEKHFTLNRDLEGPDHLFAMEPMELNEMIYFIRQSEFAIGTRESSITESETNFRSAMRSVVAKTNISKGEIFTEQNLTTKRPFLDDSVPASEYYNLIGKISSCDISEDEILTNEKVQND